MDLRERTIRNWYTLLGKPYISKEFDEAQGPFLMHISDTPSEIFPYLYRVIDLINPQYIVHTGDIVDNIKLESFQHHLYLYRREIEKFIREIEGRGCQKIYYSLGNHDDFNTIKEVSARGIILDKGVISIEGVKFYLSHYPGDGEVADYYLFGHSFVPGHYVTEKHRGLNGLLDINIIDLSTRKVYQVDYPLGTNVFRKMEKGRMGI